MAENNKWFDILRDLCRADGVSGNESNIAHTVARFAEKYGRSEIDINGNVLCSVGEQRSDRKTLLLNAHIDEIGMIVNYITDDGFLRVSKCGGIDERVLPAAQVTILGKEKLYGVVTSVPPHLQSEKGRTAKLDELYIDTGLSGERCKELISLGDRVLIENDTVVMNDLVTSKALDDRACVLAILKAVENIDTDKSAYNIKLLFSVNEEVGSRGAVTGSFDSDADLAIILDVTFGRVHGESSEEYCTIGGGAAIGVSPVLSHKLSEALMETAVLEDLTYQLEVMEGRTGTDADAVSISKSGISSCTLSIPIKYMHTPVEAVKMSDIDDTAALVSAFCKRGLY